MMSRHKFHVELKVPVSLKLLENQPELPQFSCLKYRQVRVLKVQPKIVISFRDIFSPWIIRVKSEGNLKMITVDCLL